VQAMAWPWWPGFGWAGRSLAAARIRRRKWLP
jgi:hypothetical protein